MTENMESISVIVPTYNCLSMLKETIASLENQSPSPSFFETIVVDDASTDGTAEYLKSYVGKLNLKFIINQQNMGRSITRNKGAKMSKGELLLFIDGDMRFSPDLVMGHLKRHENDEMIVLGRVIYDETLPCRGYRRYCETRGAAKLPPGTILPGRYFWSGHVSMPRHLFEQAEGFDEEFMAYGGEDLDLGMKLKALGYKMILAPELVVEHLHVRSLSEVLVTAGKYGESSIPILIRKHPELVNQLRLDWIRKGGFVSSFKKILLSYPIFTIIRLIAGILNSVAAPARIYDYLIFRSYYIGYLRSKVNFNMADN